eukprot:scaffold23471_cov141-Cylindrotheca_fusiformis.AAC.1
MDCTPQTQGMLWACIARDDKVLCSVPEQHSDPRVRKASLEILRKKATPGFEFFNSKSQSSRLKAIKFHVYEHVENTEYEITEFRLWIVAAVYDPTVIDVRSAKAFIDKIVVITEPFRDDDQNWKYGPEYCAQDSFSSVLQQKMSEAAALGKLANVQDEIDSLKQVMSRNIEMILDRGESINQLQKDSKQLNEMASVFKKKSRKIKRRMLWQNAKHGLVLGTAVTVGVAAVAAPLIAIL